MSARARMRTVRTIHLLSMALSALTMTDQERWQFGETILLVTVSLSSMRMRPAGHFVRQVSL
jgi:hypothetical protein